MGANPWDICILFINRNLCNTKDELHIVLREKKQHLQITH
jgi:hypothetical protein